MNLLNNLVLVIKPCEEIIISHYLNRNCGRVNLLIFDQFMSHTKDSRVFAQNLVFSRNINYVCFKLVLCLIFFFKHFKMIDSSFCTD